MTASRMFVKMQGVGNDFVVLDGRDAPAPDWSAVATRLCDRRRGVGADGLIVLERSEIADFRMRMHNPDGTEDVCGNGMRCIARFAAEQGLLSKDALAIETLAGVRQARICRNDLGEIESVSVQMGKPDFAPAHVPHLHPEPLINAPLLLKGGESLAVTALSTGTAHAVAFVETLPDDAQFFRISPQVENHALFPERISLMWCQTLGENRLRLRIWERGAGETWGCGTGASASAVAALLNGLADPTAPVLVESRGGTLSIRWNLDSEIEMTGPAVTVFRGVVSF